MADAALPNTFKNFINGERVESHSARTFENRNPADTTDLLGIFPASDEQDVRAAVEAARAAYKTWRLVPAPKRAEIFFRAAETVSYTHLYWRDRSWRGTF